MKNSIIIVGVQSNSKEYKLDSIALSDVLTPVPVLGLNQGRQTSEAELVRPTLSFLLTCET